MEQITNVYTTLIFFLTKYFAMFNLIIKKIFDDYLADFFSVFAFFKNIKSNDSIKGGLTSLKLRLENYLESLYFS